MTSFGELQRFVDPAIGEHDDEGAPLEGTVLRARFEGAIEVIGGLTEITTLLRETTGEIVPGCRHAYDELGDGPQMARMGHRCGADGRWLLAAPGHQKARRRGKQQSPTRLETAQ